MLESGSSARCWISVLFLAGALVGVDWAQEPSKHSPSSGMRPERARVKQFVTQYCSNCHNSDEKKGGLDLNALSSEDVAARPEAWEKVVRKLAARQMPPAGRRRPDERTYDSVVAALEAEVGEPVETDDAYERALSQLMQRHEFRAHAYEGRWQALKYPWHVLDVMEMLLERWSAGLESPGADYEQREDGEGQSHEASEPTPRGGRTRRPRRAERLQRTCPSPRSPDARRLGATVMPHNLYLHSSIAQTRKYRDTIESRREAVRFATIDSTVALMSALFINGAILVMAAAVFHGTPHENVADIGDAYLLLDPLLGATVASTLFAVALLFSGQNATLTGPPAGQIVMEGFLNIRLRPWLRRLITRLIAIVPAVVVIAISGEEGSGPLLVLSQVILSLQLPFAIFPLVQFTSSRRLMGSFVINRWVKALAWPVCFVIAGLNVYLLYQTFAEFFGG